MSAAGLPVERISDAGLILLTTGETVNGQQNKWFEQERRRINGSIVDVFLLDIDGTEYAYIKTEDCSMFSKTISKFAGATLIGNVRHDFQMHGGIDYYDAMTDFRVTDKHEYLYSTVLERQKISQFHHFHVRICDIFEHDNVLLKGREAVLARKLDKINRLETTHTTFWVYFYSLGDKEKNMFISLLLRCGGDLVKYLKREGVLFKQIHGLKGYQFTKYFEVNVLLNRIDTSVNWDQEKMNRTKPRLATVDPTDIYKACITLFKDAVIEGKRAFKYSFSQYWRQRIMLMPSGSVHSERTSDKESFKKLDYRLKTKKGFFASSTQASLDTWLDREPEINSYTSTKYEWGKTRALYGCDVSSHLHADFALNKCEETFPSYVPTGSRATEDYVAGISKGLKKFIPFCYDYDDFNSQHSFQSMTAVLLAWRDVYGGQLSSDQLESLEWTIKSVSKQFVHNSQTNDHYRTAGTLFSGWRLTTFMNTALNYAYLHAAGINQKMKYSLHNGDDVLASAMSLKEVIQLIKATERFNIRAQTSKMNIGTIAEFLRMDLHASDKTGKQYLARAISTFVHSRIESGSPRSQRDTHIATITRASEIVSRGGDQAYIDKLENKQHTFIAKLFESEDNSKKIKEFDIVAGGYKDTGYVEASQLIDVVSATESDIDISHINPGMVDYLTYIVNKFPILQDHVSMTTMEKSVLRVFNTVNSKISLVTSSKQQLKLMMSLRQAWTAITKIGNFAKARMTTADLFVALAVASPAHANALMEFEDPYKMISILL